MRYLRLLPLPVIALAGWWGLDRLESESAARFAAAQAMLRNHHVLDAGAVELAECGGKGCAAGAHKVYRLGADGDCFLFSGGQAGAALGTGMLLAAGNEPARLVLLDLDGRGVTALGSRTVKRTACPPTSPRS